MTDSWGLFALAPLVVTLVLAFVTRSAVLSMFVGVVVGVVMTGASPGSGVSELLQASLGNAGFVWICLVVMLIGVLFEQFRRSGVLAEVPRRLAATATSPRRSQLAAWGLGVLIIDDYFGPLLTGAVTRPLTDAARISREKLAFLLDANTASVCVLFPFAAWGAYLAGLIHAQAGPVATIDDALGTLIASIGWNFYAIGIVVFALLSALGVVPEFGPMRRAQQRARETDAVLRPGSRPLREVDGGDGAAVAGEPPSIALELIAPLLIVVAVVAQGLLADGGVRIVEAFGAAVAFAFVTLFWRGRLRRPVELVEVVEQGVKDVVPALLVVALAYALNAVAGRLGAEAVATYQVLLQVLALAFMVALGICGATAVLVSQAWGRGNRAAATQAAWIGLGAQCVTAGAAAVFPALPVKPLAAALVIVALPGPIAAAFTGEAGLAAAIALLLPWVALALVPDGAQAVASHALRARGDAWFPTASHIAYYVFAMPPLAWLLAEHMGRGVAGLMEAIAAGSVLAAGVLVVRMRILDRRDPGPAKSWTGALTDGR